MDPTSRRFMGGVTRTAGEPLEVDSYRSELQGIHAMLLGILAFCTFHSITEGKVTLGCDNDTSIYHSRGDWLKIRIRTSNVDLVRAIRVLKTKIPVEIVFVTVAGHQDDWLFEQELSPFERLNVAMDEAAKAHLRSVLSMDRIPRCPSTIAHEGWECYVLDRKVTSDPGPAIRFAVFGYKLRSKLIQDETISGAAFNQIDWTAIDNASKHFAPLYQLWVAKHVSGFFGVGHMMRNWKFWDHSRCPCCDHEDETKLHLLTCPHPDCAFTWSESLAGFREWLIEVDTDPSIQDCLLRTLATRDPHQSFTAFSDESSFDAAQEQDAIGWVFATEGKVSNAWRKTQNKYYKTIGSSRCSWKWAAGLVTNLLHLTHAQWIHRCNVLHARDAEGLKIKEAKELADSIRAQFALGLDGLLTRDHHYINRGLDQVEALPADNKKAWLRGILIARDLYLSSEVSEMESMRRSMQQWLSPA